MKSFEKDEKILEIYKKIGREGITLLAESGMFKEDPIAFIYRMKYREAQRRFYYKNTKKIADKKRKDRDKLSKSYIAQTLHIPVKELTPEIEETKRMQLMLKSVTDKKNTYVCPICNEKFESISPNRKYCSRSCCGVAKRKAREIPIIPIKPIETCNETSNTYIKPLNSMVIHRDSNVFNYNRLSENKPLAQVLLQIPIVEKIINKFWR